MVNFTKNGLWIRENTENYKRIIFASKPDGIYLLNVEIFHIDQNMNLIEKINSKRVNIKNNNWITRKCYSIEIFRGNF